MCHICMYRSTKSQALSTCKQEIGFRAERWFGKQKQ